MCLESKDLKLYPKENTEVSQEKCCQNVWSCTRGHGKVSKLSAGDQLGPERDKARLRGWGQSVQQDAMMLSPTQASGALGLQLSFKSSSLTSDCFSLPGRSKPDVQNKVKSFGNRDFKTSQNASITQCCHISIQK